MIHAGIERVFIAFSCCPMGNKSQTLHRQIQGGHRPPPPKINNERSLKAAILDFEKVNFIKNDPYMTTNMLTRPNNEHDTKNNKGDIAQNYENRP